MWCENKITINGKFDEILNILNSKKICFLFKRFFPEIESGNGFTYRMMFGCKRDVYMIDVLHIIKEEKLILSFETSYTPCISFCEKISKKFNVHLKLEYFDSEIIGKFIFDKGVMIFKEKRKNEA